VQAEHLRLPALPCRGHRRRTHDDRSVSSHPLLHLFQCPALPVGSATASGTALTTVLRWFLDCTTVSCGY
jgi:hypothetical protein